MASTRVRMAAPAPMPLPVGISMRLRDGLTVVEVALSHPASWTTGQILASIALFEEVDGPVILTGQMPFGALEAPTPAQPELDHFLAVIAAHPHPVVSMIQGHAQGPGLELALACHHRVAHASARFSFPEVSRGTLPVNGGIERLTRLVGAARAAELVVFGKVLTAPAALQAGIIDAIATDNLEETALAMARTPAKTPALPETGWVRPLAELREQVRRRRPGQTAPLAAVQALEHAHRWPLPRALAETRKLAETLGRSEQAQALRYAAISEARLLVSPTAATPAPSEAEVAASLRRKAAEIEFHIFAPGRRVRLIEIIPAADTPPETRAALADLMRRLGKPALFRTQGAQGSLLNRLRWPMLREAIHLLDEGATPVRVDRALLAFGFAFAPFAALDQEGLEEFVAGCLTAPDPWDRYSPTIDLMFDAGRLGVAAGRGWYHYENGHAGPIMDRDVERLLAESAQAQRIGRHGPDDAEIVRRCLAAGLASSSALLASSEAPDQAEIDAIWTAVLGFPRWRGGLMYHACHASGEWRPEISPRSAPPLLPPPPAGRVRPDARRPQP